MANPILKDNVPKYRIFKILMILFVKLLKK
jgi:hypothetical protein